MAQLVDACGREPHCCEFESRSEHHRLVTQFGRGNTLRPCPVSVRIRPSLPILAPVFQMVEIAALKAAQCRFESGQAHHMPRLPMLRRADSKPATGCSNHPRGAMRRNSKWRAAELQPRCARFDSAAALQKFARGGVDELLKSPVPKTGVSP